ALATQERADLWIGDVLVTDKNEIHPLRQRFLIKIALAGKEGARLVIPRPDQAEVPGASSPKMIKKCGGSFILLASHQTEDSFPPMRAPTEFPEMPQEHQGYKNGEGNPNDPTADAGG